MLAVVGPSYNNSNNARLTAIFQHNPKKPVLRMSPFWILLLTGVVVKTGTVRHANLQSNRHHQQTIVTHSFLQLLHLHFHHH